MTNGINNNPVTSNNLWVIGNTTFSFSVVPLLARLVDSGQQMMIKVMKSLIFVSNQSTCTFEKDLKLQIGLLPGSEINFLIRAPTGDQV